MPENQYAYWEQALQRGKGRQLDPQMLDLLPPLAGEIPQSGFWRRRAYKGGPYVAVAIWRDDDGKLWCLENGKERDCEWEYFSYCVSWPISAELYGTIAEGGLWPDQVNPIGHNQPPKTGDDAVDMKAEFEQDKSSAEELLKSAVADQDTADKIAHFAKQMAERKNTADSKFAVEKRPWLDGSNAVDARWRFRADAEAMVKKLKKHLQGWFDKLRRDEEERVAREAAAAAKLKREAEEAATRAAKARVIDEEHAQVAGLFETPDEEARRRAAKDRAEEEAQRLQEAALAAEREAAPRRISAGSTGARVSTTKVWHGKVTDFDRCYAALKGSQLMQATVAAEVERLGKLKDVAMPDGSERWSEEVPR